MYTYIYSNIPNLLLRFRRRENKTEKKNKRKKKQKRREKKKEREEKTGSVSSIRT